MRNLLSWLGAMWTAVHNFYQRHFWEIPEPLARELKSRLRPGMRTLETGSGRSTLIFEEMGCEHVALEHRAVHAPRCHSVRVVPLVGDPPWYDWEPTHPFDLILIDGPPFWIGRAGILRVLPHCAGRSTIFILDDAQRHCERRLAERIAADYGLEIQSFRYWELGVFPRRFVVLEPRKGCAR